MSNSAEACLRGDERKARRARIVRWSILGALAALAITYFVLSAVGAAAGRQLRVAPTVLLLLVPLGVAPIYVVTWFGWWTVKRFRGGGRVKRGARFVGVAALWLFVAANAVPVLLVAAFLPIEHEVEFAGENAVAEVNAFLDVNVTYFGYISPLFMSADEIGSEWYGSGGYDPLTRDPVPDPVRRTVRGVEVISPPEPPVREELTDEFAQPRPEEEVAAEALAETEAAFEETGSVYRVTGTVTSSIDDGSFSFRVDDGEGVLEDGSTYRVEQTKQTRRLFGMKGLQWGMDGVVVGFASPPDDDGVLHAGVIIGNDDTSSDYWESMPPA